MAEDNLGAEVKDFEDEVEEKEAAAATPTALRTFLSRLSHLFGPG